MNRTRTALCAPLALGALAVTALAGCHGPSGNAAAAPAPPIKVTPAAAVTPAPRHSPQELARIKPNELGYIPVLMYHAIGEHGGFDRHGLNIPADTFRRQLQLMYEAGWYPVNMRDVILGRMDVPAGKTPVVLTFDDGRETQFIYRADGSIDPNCAVGILNAFHAKHPDWPLRGTFYLIGTHEYNPVPFCQPKTLKKKLDYLLQQGYEIANHSTTHRYMNQNHRGWVTAKSVQWEEAECVRYVKAIAPTATMDTYALPGGGRPHNKALWPLLMAGQEGGTAYKNLCVLDAWGGPTLPPGHKKFDPSAVLRIGTEPGYVEGWIRRMKRGSEYAPYVSDGDPNTIAIPKSQEKWLDRGKVGAAQVVEWNDVPPKKPGAEKAAVRKGRLAAKSRSGHGKSVRSTK